MKLKTKLILLMALVIALSYGVTFYRTADFQEKLVVEQATQQAKMLFNQIRLTRQWISDHNGLFLVKEAGVEANPFLEHGEIQDADGTWLVKRNPAMVTRELSAYAAREGMGQFNVTSLKPVNPLNAPDDFERRSLESFNQGATEAVEIDRFQGSYRLRYIAPLAVDNRCLECHGKQGYQLGDIRGGMNVTIPMDWAFAEIGRSKRSLILIALITILIVSLSIYLLFDRLVAKRLERLATSIKNYPQKMLDIPPNDLVSHDEIGLLNRRFSGLCERLEKSQQDLDATREQVFRNEKQAALGRLVAGISHEVNNPLGGMQNCIQMMKRNPDESALQQRYLELLELGVKRIKGTVSQLLNIGRKEPLENSRGDVDKVIRDCLELSCLGHKNISVDFDLLVHQPVTTGFEALRQILLNLAGNAVQAIGTEQGWIKVSSRLENKQLLIHICDSGPGIPQENLDKVFEPFFTTKEVGEGTGLGLSVTDSLVKQLHGEICVSNDPVAGACFKMRIPLTAETSES